MKRRTQILLGSAIVIAGAAAGTGIAVASSGGSGDDHDVSITGAALDQASAAALARTGGGRVTATEVGDEESYYQVEVTLDSGGQVDVQLDKDFVVVSSSSDRETASAEN